ncbi:hypothetical protein [Sphingomonas quercus]|uniref:Uncharacterized protein n=1 Tax=Sphingomonas quercus TaxID=2842451 RepID=A0ABS6BJC4_9SPHN|nr:hypothetical protein [Sphingomonas quercus]MBU3077952.1 hypothetical protein [Sphingomonas quercus]
MIGLDQLGSRIAAWGDEELLLWLSQGVAAIPGPADAETETLAFRPLIFSRSEPALQQLHFALDRIDRAAFERVRIALARLLGAWRPSDDPGFTRMLWSLAISLKPAAGVIEAANHLVSRIDSNDTLRDRFADCVETIAAAVLVYPRSDPQDRFMASLRRTGLLSDGIALNHVLHLVRDDAPRWLDWLGMYAAELEPPKVLPKSFARQLVLAVGGDVIFPDIAYMTYDNDLSWVQTWLMPLLNPQHKWNGVEVSLGGKLWTVRSVDSAALSQGDADEQYFTFVGQAGPPPRGAQEQQLRTLVAGFTSGRGRRQ